MTAHVKTDLRSFGIDKTRVQKIVEMQNVQTGFVPDVTATAERGRAKMIAEGVRPEDNIGSCGIIAAREEAQPYSQTQPERDRCRNPHDATANASLAAAC